MLTKRMIEILKVVIDEFVATAEPVSSKILVNKYRLPYSSATIRNDMAALEVMGYIEKPHTSAGRIPSSKGYQFYCEHLLKKDIDEEVKYAISNIFAKESMNVDDAVKESCKIISDMTNLTSGVLGPDGSHQTLEHIQVFPLDKRTAVCVLITNTGHTENKTFNFRDDVSVDDIKNCTDILNDRLKDTPISELSVRLESLRPILSQSVKRHEMLFNAFAGAFVKFASETLYFNGTTNMIYQPEYADIEKLRELSKLFSNHNMFRDFLTRSDGGNDIVAITPKGTELVWKDDLAILTSEINLGNSDNARLLIVGPKRMEYSRVVALLDFITDEIEKVYRG